MSESQRVGLLKKELALMKKLRELTLNTPQAVGEENLSSLLALLAQREKILKEISRYQEKMEKGQPPSSIQADEKEAIEITEEIKSIYGEISELDRQLGKSIKEEKDQVLEKMGQIRQGHRALKGYSSPRIRIPRYCDKKG